MKPESRLRIEQAAYELIDEFGYDSISMLKIAKRAKASNETMYKWYGDKKGLFGALVEANAAHISQLIESSFAENQPLAEALGKLGPLLLEILLGPRAIALNKAAIADPSGDLGRALAQFGRETVFPMICKMFQQFLNEHQKTTTEAEYVAEIYLRLLIGDLQIRRATGAISEMTMLEIQQRAEDALQLVINIVTNAPLAKA